MAEAMLQDAVAGGDEQALFVVDLDEQERVARVQLRALHDPETLAGAAGQGRDVSRILFAAGNHAGECQPDDQQVEELRSFHCRFLLCRAYRAQLGCELLPEILATSLTCFVGTSSTDKTRPWLARRANTTVREFGAHDGSSPSASSTGTA